MKKKILIVDDEELNRELLRQLFEDSYQILLAGDGEEAMGLFLANHDELSAVLLDLVMPKMDGYSMLEILNREGYTATVPVILITAQSDIDTMLKCYSIGAAEIINKPFVAAVVKRRVQNMVEMYTSREELRHSLLFSEQRRHEQERQLAKFSERFIEAISDIVEFRDMESGQHVRRVMGFTRILASCYARLYPECGLTCERIDAIAKMSALHDIGKIVIPDSILLKPGRLTDEERRIMQSHTTKGCEILSRLEDTQSEEYSRISYEIVRYHHERYDGAGYPDGLKGDEIPLSAQFVSVADVYDALLSERTYKKAYDKETTYRMILNGECGIFAPRLLECLRQTKKIMESLADSLNSGGEEIALTRENMEAILPGSGATESGGPTG